MIASPRTLAAHVLRAMADDPSRRVDLPSLASELEVRRADLRRTLSALHREGYVDVARMRLTLAGFAIGTALRGAALAPVRQSTVRVVAA